MAAIAKAWHLMPHDPDAILYLSRTLSISPVIAQLLLNRGYQTASEAKRFLECPLKGLHPPESLPGVPAAVERISKAIAAKERICIYGDYDVDGTTGTAILLRLFQTLRVPAEYYVPHRLEEGYGVNATALRDLAARGVNLVITVDCGIASVAEALLAKELGLSMIITDHHEFKSTLPDASVLVHPRLPGSDYPFAGLCGSAVAFKLAWALAIHHTGSERVGPALREFLLDALTYATLGVVADVVPLQDENRIIVRFGLERMASEPTVGLSALLQVCRVEAGQKIKAEDVAFKLAPRINAAGRLGSARRVVEMLTTRDETMALQHAEYLQEQNEMRKQLESVMTDFAHQLVESEQLAKQPALILASDTWHPGIMGIVASRMVDAYGRPTLMVAMNHEEGVATGSGRSIHGFALHEALQACDALLIGHGGHAAAAGFRLRIDQLSAFRELFCSYAASHFPTGVPPAPQLVLDAELPLSSLTWNLIKDLDQLEPYGAANRRPRFLVADLEVSQLRRIGSDGKHLSFRVHQGSSSFRAVAWNVGDRYEELMGNHGCCLAFSPKINEWNGQRNIELEVHDFQATNDAALE